ncbi:hypothetical protein LCGC14_1735600 [marine sediment metagenome]|uniref:Uncharacterized protein n=1 Tax=marine sediment metagenome TaxID=412755 RepID=A0A0F9JNP5_9ZZZZ
MGKFNLTKAYVQRVNDLSITNFKIPILDIKELEKYPFLLVIQSVIENNIKLSIYPLKKEKIIKVSLSGFNLTDKIFEGLSKILRGFQVIHTSGVILIEKRLFYECYLNISMSEEKTKNLKASFNKIKNIFEEIKIEEIGLKKIEKK